MTGHPQLPEHHETAFLRRRKENSPPSSNASASFPRKNGKSGRQSCRFPPTKSNFTARRGPGPQDREAASVGGLFHSWSSSRQANLLAALRSPLSSLAWGCRSQG